MRSISVATIKEAVNVLLDRLLEVGINDVPLDKQYYWKVLEDEKYVLSTQPHELGVGDLFDDLEFSEMAASSGEDAVVLSLISLAPVIAYLGEVGGEMQVKAERANGAGDVTD